MVIEGRLSEKWKAFDLRSFLLVSCALWFIAAVIFTLKYGTFQFSEGKPVLWRHIFFYNFNSNLIWMILTPVLLWILIKIIEPRRPWYSLLIIILPTIIITATLQSTLFLLLDHFLQNALNLWSLSMTVSEYFDQYFIEQILDATLTCVVTIGLLFGYIQYHQSKWIQKQKLQLEADLVRTRINGIKHQLQPHFLFNSLQTISNLIHVDQQAADTAVAELSEILRASIKQLNQDKISLEKEMRLVRKYLEFQKIRFGDKIKYSITIEPNIRHHQVPVFLFQPLVENSIKHGFAKTGAPMTIGISVTQKGNEMLLEIRDDGAGFSDKGMRSESTGLNNLSHRLNYLYPNNHEFSIESNGLGTNVFIQLPLEN